MDRISFKKAIINGYCVAPSIESFLGNPIVVVTPAGIINGDFVEKNDSNKQIESLNNFNDTIIKKYIKDLGLPEDKLAPGNDGFFSLKNAVIINENSRTEIGFINIFYDQVIAITLGRIND